MYSDNIRQVLKISSTRFCVDMLSHVLHDTKTSMQCADTTTLCHTLALACAPPYLATRADNTTTLDHTLGKDPRCTRTLNGSQLNDRYRYPCIPGQNGLPNIYIYSVVELVGEVTMVTSDAECSRHRNSAGPGFHRQLCSRSLESAEICCLTTSATLYDHDIFW